MADAEAATRDLYRRNPARDIERFAVGSVQDWVADAGLVDDTSDGHGPDFCIHYADGRIGWGEVAWHADADLQEMWSNIFRHEDPQQVPLPSGLGYWAVTLAKGASIKGLYKGLPGLVDQMVKLGCNRLAIEGGWPRGEPADTARLLGIDYIDRVANTPDAAIFVPPLIGGIVPADPGVVSDWVTEVLADPDYADTTGKLLALPANERHVFLMSGSRTPYGIDQRLRRLSESLPSRSPVVQNEITHVWVISHCDGSPAGLWTRAHGWTVVPVPTGLRTQVALGI